MKRLLLPLLAAISFSIPVFANTPPSVRAKIPSSERNLDWLHYLINEGDMLAAAAIILGIILVLIIFLLGAWLAPTPEEQEAEERRIKQYKKQYKKEKLISYGHDMKGLEEKYREVKIYREED